jgi:hypothetical protein
MRHVFLIGATALAIVAAVVACSSSTTAKSGADAGSGDDGSGDGTPTTPTTPVTTTDAAIPVREPTIYAHSPNTLFKFNPTTNTLTTIAQFSGPGCTGESVTDLAIAADGSAYVTTFNGFAKVNLTTAVCTSIADRQNAPNSLGFVPGTGGQQLVAYIGDQYYRVNPATADMTPLGQLSDGLQSSGDIATLGDAGTFLSAFSDDCNDCLVRIDPATGSSLQVLGDIGTDSVYGLAASSSAVYAFSGNGVVFKTIPLADGGLASTLVYDAGTPSFFGAASGPPQ